MRAVVSLVALVLLATASAQLLPPMGRRLGTCSVVRTRREIRDLTQAQRNRFFAAWKRMQQSGELDVFIKAHTQEMGHYSDVHETPLFLPFHRAFLREMEDVLAKYLPSGEGIPYWDSSVDSSDGTKSILFTDAFLGRSNVDGVVIDGAFSSDKYQLDYPAIHPLKRNHAGKECVLYSSLVIEDFLTQDTFSHMSTSIEGSSYFSSLTQGGPHNIVHYCIGGTGGDMQSTHSPNDPLFFLHHAFIDKLWNKWQTKQGGKNQMKYDGKEYKLTKQYTLNTNLVYYDIPVRSVMDSADLCVKYVEKGIQSTKQVVDRNMKEIKVPHFGEDWFAMGKSRKLAEKVEEETEDIVEEKNEKVFKIKPSRTKRVKPTEAAVSGPTLLSMVPVVPGVPVVVKADKADKATDASNSASGVSLSALALTLVASLFL